MSSPELPEHPREGRLVSPEAAEAALVRKPQIGDTRPAPIMPVAPPTESAPTTSKKENPIRRNRQKIQTHRVSPLSQVTSKIARNRVVVTVAVVVIDVADLVATVMVRVPTLRPSSRQMPS